MTILLFGVSNVGKTTTGELLAERLNFDFYDLDEEVKKKLNITLEEFVSTGTLYERDQTRCQLIHSLVSRKNSKVIAVTPLTYVQDIETLFSSPSVMAVELLDSAKNIFDRLVFSDENDIIYKDDVYKNKHKKHYISEIKEDLKWHASVYRNLEHHFHMNGRPPEEVVSGLITEYRLDIL